ncbi:MAG: glutaredoxin [Berryella intestinalis]|nr:glutaredoxin [Berryella intestinalis]
MAKLENHVLYWRPTCPFCVRVVAYMDEHGIECERRNVLEDLSAYDDLVAIGGKRQIPCLVIEGRALYESSDIIAYCAQYA